VAARSRVPVLGVTGVAILLAAATTAAIFAWRFLDGPMRVADEGEWLDVPVGTPLIAVSDELADRGILNNAWLFSFYARLAGDATRIKAGEYRIAAGPTPRQLLAQLVGGQVYLHQLTIVEGWRFEDLVTALREHPSIDANDLNADTIMETLGKGSVDPQGQFYPDTYRFPRGTTGIELLRQAHEALETALASAWVRRSGSIAVKSPYEALILASIIEKETALATERRQIAGVFHRRLQRGMRLQTDPSVIYGLGADFDGNLRRGDLARDTPYNTYTRAGLPPTPIALPGGQAIIAAVDPEPGTALYFVATGQPDGSHFFSTSLDEHNQAVAQYLQRLRNPTPE